MPDAAATARQRTEAAVYDERVRETLARIPDDDLLVGRVRPPYPNREHIDFLDFALQRLAPLRGSRILEVGCGTGALSTYLALQGAEVVGVDVAGENIAVARRRARVSGAEVDFRDVPVELLREPDASFDGIIGNQVLHHFELGDAMPNLQRMLKRTGRGVFCEPVLLIPPPLRRLRDSRAVTRVLPRRVDTPTERSISPADLRFICDTFPASHLYPFQLTARLQNFVELDDRWFSRLERADRVLLRRVAPLRRMARYVVVEVANDPSLPPAPDRQRMWTRRSRPATEAPC